MFYMRFKMCVEQCKKNCKEMRRTEGVIIRFITYDPYILQIFLINFFIIYLLNKSNIQHLPLELFNKYLSNSHISNIFQIYIICNI